MLRHIMLTLMVLIMSTQLHAQEWLDKEEYPFEHKYIQLMDGKMHYVDEGAGNETILFVHGTPTWSFLYRDFIKTFAEDYRVIAIDHIGYGLSEKPAAFPGRPQDHAKNLSELIHKLDLRNITLVVHDFGGPIGLSTAIKYPDRFNRIISFNTWLWETESNEEAHKIDKIINSFLGRFMYLRLNFSPRVLLKKGFADGNNLPKHRHKQYIHPYPNKQSRLAMYRIAQSLVGESDWYQQQWELLSKIEDLSWLILWGVEDEFLSTDHLSKWKHRLPNAEVHTFDSGHFVQEERTQQAITLMKEFMHTKVVSSVD